jgi:WD40 repeat protein
MSLSRTKFPKHCVTLFACCFVGLWALSSPCLADDLFVGNFFGSDSKILEYNATTGAFIGQFGPANSFPLGAAFGPDGNFYATNSNIDVVLKQNGTTGAFISNFASVGDAAGLVFGPNNNLFVVSSSDPGSLTVLNATTGALKPPLMLAVSFPIPKALPSAPTRTSMSPIPITATSSSSTEPPARSWANLSLTAAVG